MYNLTSATLPASHKCSEEAIHLWLCESSRKSYLDQLSYQTNGEKPTNFLCRMNDMNHISPVPEENNVAISDGSSTGRNFALWWEQKSMVLMKDVLRKVMKALQLVLDPFSGSFATAKAFMLLPKHL